MGDGQYGEAFLIAVISTLATALSVVARTAYMSMREERNFMREEVLTALRVIIERVATSATHRDDTVREINTKLDNIRRLILQRPRNGGGDGAK